MRARRARAAGVLLHPTSLPGGHGVGDLGAGARWFLRWLERAGVRCWQILPQGPTGDDGSPYGSWSALAGNPLLLDLEGLRGDGLLTDADLRACPENSATVDWAEISAFKRPLIARAAEALLRRHPVDRLYPERLPEWLAAHGAYTALREASGEPWWCWPEDWQPDGFGKLAEEAPELAAQRDRHVAIQWLFDRQLSQLRTEATARGITLFGDVPIYVAQDSADTWAHRSLFQLGADGRPTHIAGVPPDAFSETGQRWGNPLYDWPRHEEQGHAWWIARIRRAVEQTPIVRIDHFRGLAAYWAVPADDEDARNGSWIEGPGRALFEAIERELGEVDLVAEDLGLIDEPVRQLQAAAGLPGMSVLQFAFGGGANNAYLPHHHDRASVCYVGTHDNDTALGWWQQSPEHVRDHARRYLGVSGADIAWDLIRQCLASVADRAVVTPQDVLGLGSDARMNLPGTTEGNWSWRLRAGELQAGHADRLRGLVELYGRAAER